MGGKLSMAAREAGPPVRGSRAPVRVAMTPGRGGGPTNMGRGGGAPAQKRTYDDFQESGGYNQGYEGYRKEAGSGMGAVSQSATQGLAAYPGTAAYPAASSYPGTTAYPSGNNAYPNISTYNFANRGRGRGNF